MRKMQLLLILLLAWCMAPHAKAHNLQNNWWITNGTVNTIVQQGNIVYLGGSFNSIGPEIKFGVSVDDNAGLFNNTMVLPNGDVFAVISDGANGWYIGGNFTQVGSQNRSGLARINADGTLHPFNPVVNGTVLALLLDGSTLYVGGQYSNIASSGMSNLAAINITNSSIVPGFDPRVNGKVNAIGLNKATETLYVGGVFSAARSNTGPIAAIGLRSNVCALSTVNGVLTSFVANTDAEVFAVHAADNAIYIGGAFTVVNNISQNYIASVNATTGVRNTAFNPSPNNTVRAIRRAGNLVVVGGDFTIFGGQNRNYLASLDERISGTDASTWNPDPNGPISTIHLVGQSAYVGGTFTAVGSLERNRVAEINVITSVVSSWNPSASNRVLAIAKNGTNVYLGGNFESINCLTRNNAAAIDINSGIATSFNPNVNGVVNAITFNGSLVYLGGNFTGVFGQVRNRLAAVDANTGVPTTWNPGANGAIHAMTLNCNTLYVGGSFSQLGGQTRNGAGAINLNTGLATAWNPNINGVVYAMAFRGQNLFVGGKFTNIGVASRSNLAEIELSTASVTGFNISPNDTVYSIINAGRMLYIGGAFNSLVQGVSPFSRLGVAGIEYRTTAAVGAAVGSFTGGAVRAIALDQSTLYVAGDFNVANSSPTASLVSINVDNGNLGSFNSGLVRPMRAVSYYFGRLNAGGLYQQGIPSFNSSYFHYTTSGNAINLSSISGSICRGSDITLSFSATGNYNTGNIFEAYLSDAEGDFSNAVLIGSLASTNANSMVATIPANTSPGTCYRIRIIATNLNTVSNPTNSFQIFNNCNNLIAKLQPADCGRTDFLLGGPAGIVNNVIWAEQGIPGVITYRFNIYDSDGINLLGTVNSPVRFMIPGNFPHIFAVNTSYTVRVQIENMDGWGFEGDACRIGFRGTPVISEVANINFNAAICGTSNFNLNGTDRIAGIDLVNIVRNSRCSNYEVEVYNASGTQFLGQIFVPSGNLFLRNHTNIFQAGNGYQLRVRGYMGPINGNWSALCSIFIQGPPPTALPTTQFRANACGRSTYVTIGNGDVSGIDFVPIDRINGITGYEVEISSASGRVLSIEPIGLGAKFYLRNYPQHIVGGTTYMLRVRTVLNAQVSAWSQTCTITTISNTATIPSTRIRQCGLQVTNIGNIRANDVAGASVYRFTFFSDASCTNQVAQVMSNVNLSLLNVTPTLQAGTTYYVLVQAQIGNNFGGFNVGDTCALHLIAPPLRLSGTSTNVSVYPNPFIDGIQIVTLHASGFVRVFDMQGRIVKEQVIQQAIEQIQLNVQQGIYLVQIVDGTEQPVTIRVIKQ